MSILRQPALHGAQFQTRVIALPEQGLPHVLKLMGILS